MPGGWFRFSRRLLSSDLWLGEPFTRGQAWIDLVGLARFENGSIRKRGVQMEIPRGVCSWSENELAERWQWSRGKVRRFLHELETVQQIVQQKNNVTSCIHIVNYERHQTDGTADGTANGQQTVQQNGSLYSKDLDLKNVKKGKNDKKRSRSSAFVPPTTDQVREYAQSIGFAIDAEYFCDYYETRGWMAGKAKMKSWEGAVRTWKRNDKGNGDARKGQYTRPADSRQWSAEDWADYSRELEERGE